MFTSLHFSHFMCPVPHFLCMCRCGEAFGWGSVINGAYPSSHDRITCSRQDYLLQAFYTPLHCIGMKGHMNCCSSPVLVTLIKERYIFYVSAIFIICPLYVKKREKNPILITQKRKLWQNSTTQIVKKIQNSNCQKAQKTNFEKNLKT